jgi:protease I
MARGLLLAADGVDASQLEYAYHRLREDAILVTIASPGGGKIEAESGATWSETTPITGLSQEFDFVIVPGGAAPERLRLSSDAVGWLRRHEAEGAIVAVLGHGVQLLASAGILGGRTITGPPELQVDIENGGATYTGESVAVDGTLVTGRGTAALPFFVSATISSALIPQDPASKAQERPHWDAPES